METDSTPLVEALGDLVERFDHVAVAVKDLRTPGPLPALLSGRFYKGGAETDSGFAWAQWLLPEGKLEIIAPLGEDSFLHAFLAERGEGLHHVTVKVTDIHRAIEASRDLGAEIVQVDTSQPDWKEAFVHPRSASGVLVQLAEFPDSDPPVGRTFEDVIAEVYG